MNVGLVSQLHGHMPAVAIVSFMGAEVVLSPAQTRAIYNVRQEDTQKKRLSSSVTILEVTTQ